jgi:hypothetical protein
MLSIYETDKRKFAEDMLPHYLECAAWADTPEDIESGLDFDNATEEMALADCMRFVGLAGFLLINQSPEQVGHDFWLTRNHHGAGFWDRPEIYGSKENAEKLTEIAHGFGERYIFEHNGKLIIE